MLQEKNCFARSIDIAADICITKPNVSYATKRLGDNGKITMSYDR